MFLVKKNRLMAAIVLVCMLFSALPMMSAFAETETILESYSEKEAYEKKEQGADGWYWRYLVSGVSTNLPWNAGKSGWSLESGYPMNRSNLMNPTTDNDVEKVFVSPQKGNVHLTGTVMFTPNGNPNNLGDGVTLSILRGDEIMWTGKLVSPNTIDYDVSFSVKKNQEIKFRVNPNNHSAYDNILWQPVVNFVGGDYSAAEEKYKYYSFSNGNYTEMTYDEEYDGGVGRYVGSDGVAYVNDDIINPTAECTIVKQYTVQQAGKHRVYANIELNDKKSSGLIATVKRNGITEWQQLMPPAKTGTVDVRMQCKVGDVLNVEISVNGSSGFSGAEWSCDITKNVGTRPCVASTSVGQTYALQNTVYLSSLVRASQSGGVAYYSLYNDVKFPMTYNSSTKTWSSPVSGDGAYISTSAIMPGALGDAVLEYTVDKTADIRIEGNLNISDKSDGVLAKIYINDNLLYSNRVGGERSVRFDEPYDVCYFNNEINTVAHVNQGDKITFRFGRWRLNANDNFQINDIRIKYLYDNSNPLSETTKWKLAQSAVVDTVAKTVHKDGKTESIDVKTENGTTYIKKSDLYKIFGGESNGISDYEAIRIAATENSKSVSWVADRLAIVYTGIPVMYGYPENAEISLAIERGSLYD